MSLRNIEPLNTKASRLMELHTHTHHDAPCPLLLAVTNLTYFSFLAETMFSLYIQLHFLNTTRSHKIAFRRISCSS